MPVLQIKRQYLYLSMAILASLFIVFYVVSASAAEFIDAYVSDITVHKNGELSVDEKITVNVQHQNIKHGIYRDFPTRYHDTSGHTQYVRFDVDSVKLDGTPVFYISEPITNGTRLIIGDPHNDVALGKHTYEIAYTTDRQIKQFQDFDELYWNVTGNSWSFPMASVKALVHLPESAYIRWQNAYTGPYGSRRNASNYFKISDSYIDFMTTSPLGRHEGMSIMVDFAKGSIRAPTMNQKIQAYLWRNLMLIWTLAGIITMTGYFLVIWWRVGRDPARPVAIPLFNPPANLSPAAVRYIRQMGFDRKIFAAALINMAVKGFIKINKQKHIYTLERTATQLEAANLSSEEKVIAENLFTSGVERLELTKSNQQAIRKAFRNCASSLSSAYDDVYFFKHFQAFVGGIFILIVASVAASFCADGSKDTLYLLGGPALFTAVLMKGGYRTVYMWYLCYQQTSARTENLKAALKQSALLFIILLLVIADLFQSAQKGYLVICIIMAVGGALAALFHYLIKAPTPEGAAIMSEIQGFDLYLSTAETDRFEKLNPPQITPEIFDKFIPYAIALDCENTWSKRFSAASAAAINPRNYFPYWYIGGDFDTSGSGLTDFTSTLGHSIADAATAASTPSGGFSGGGVGGGGGGGW